MSLLLRRVCQSADQQESQNTILSSLFMMCSTCHLVVLSDGERIFKATAKVDLLQQLAEDSVVQALDLFGFIYVSFANLFRISL